MLQLLFRLTGVLKYLPFLGYSQAYAHTLSPSLTLCCSLPNWLSFSLFFSFFLSVVLDYKEVGVKDVSRSRHSLPMQCFLWVVPILCYSLSQGVVTIPAARFLFAWSSDGAFNIFNPEVYKVSKLRHSLSVWEAEGLIMGLRCMILIIRHKNALIHPKT